MYTPPPFKPDRAASLGFADARGFGTVCAWDGSKPIASLVPFHLGALNDGTPQAFFHVARNNPLAKVADGATPWLLASSRMLARFSRSRAMEVPACTSA